jgi:hypothetical protein
MELVISVPQNPRTHSWIRRGASGLCRAFAKRRTLTDVPATAATDARCCGGTSHMQVSAGTSAGGITRK